MAMSVPQTAPELTKTMLSGEAIAEQFHRNLLSNEAAMEYVLSRGIKQSQIDAGLVGLCSAYSNHWFPLMRGRITVPIRDAHGKILAFAGRQHEPMRELTERALWDKYSDEPKKAEDRVQKWLKGKWLNEPFPKNRHLYNLDLAKDAAREMGYLVIVEGYFDALVLAGRSLPNTVAVCGVALSDYHCALIARYCRRVVVILDPDAAGQKGLAKMIPKLEDASIEWHAVYLPDNYDPDQFAIKFGGKNLRRGIEQMIEADNKELKINIKE
jgi:DNA primase